MMKKLLLVAFILILGLLTVTPNMVHSSNLLEVDSLEKRTYEVFNDKLNQIKGDSDIFISNVKTAVDFAGNTYNIIECNPIGYMIYSVETGIFVEYSIYSSSPYYDRFDNLFYGGPTFYYYFSDKLLQHTILDEMFFENDMEIFTSSSKDLHEELSNKKDDLILEYIKTGKKNNNITPQATYVGVVNDAGFFRNLNRFGDVDGNLCGYIGLNMMIAYHDKYKNKASEDIMDDVYWYNQERTALKNYGESLSQYLYNLDPKSGTTSSDIHNVMKKYCGERNLSYSHTSRAKPFYTIETVTNAIDRNTPVEAFGDLGNPASSGTISHAVVIYKYESKVNFLGIAYDADYTCHFGWYGYNEVVITGLITSIYFFE